MRLIIQPTLWDVLEVNKTLREQRIKGWLAVALGLGILLFSAWEVNVARNPRDFRVAYASGAAFVVLGLLTTRIAGLGGWLLKTSRESFLLEVTDEDVAIIRLDGRYALPWGGFRRWCVTQNLLILIGLGDCLVVIPKRDCTVDVWRHLHEMVERRIGPPSRW